MTNFILRLLKRRGVDKTKRPAHKENDSTDDDDDDDEGFIDSKFDYEEGAMSSQSTIPTTLLPDVHVCLELYLVN